MKQDTARDRADEEVEKIKWALKNTGLNYYMEESPFRLSIHIKKSLFKDFSPRLPVDLTQGPVLTSTSSPPRPNSTPVEERPETKSPPSGLVSLPTPSCPSCHDKEMQLGYVRRELVKALVDVNETNENLEKVNSKLLETNEKQENAR